jgi:6-phosphogluconolactonase
MTSGRPLGRDLSRSLLASARAIRYGGRHMTRLQIDVYPTDAEAYEAAAALAAAHVREAAAARRPTLALAGGRSGRGVMVALAARGDLPWDRVEWFWGDERCVAPDDLHSNVRVARDSLFVPRGIAAERIHPPPLELADPARIAEAYGATIAAHLAPAGGFDVLLLGVGVDGEVASLMPGSAALDATTPVAAVPASEVRREPRVARITVTPSALRASRRVIVTVVGDAKAAVVAATMRGEGRLPAQLVMPSDRVTWVLDRAAAADLLRDAHPAPA